MARQIHEHAFVDYQVWRPNYFAFWASDLGAGRMKDLLIGLTIALAVYAFVFRPAHTRRVADKAAGGAAGGAPNATKAYLGRADQVWQVFAVVAGLLVFWMFFRADDRPTPANETAEATETEEAAATTEGIAGPLNVGDQGADVIALQERLAAEGLPVTVDGVYGQETADAVMAFQEQEQLTVDGVVGSETADALGIWSSLLAPSARPGGGWA